MLISVEKCSCIWLLEDFLKNRVRSMDDAKSLRIPPSFDSTGTGIKPGSNAEKVLNELNDKLRDMVESEGMSDPDEFAEVISEYILDLLAH